MKLPLNKVVICCALVACMLVSLSFFDAAAADDTDSETGKAGIRVGTFDSRLVATAYVRSAFFERRIAKMRADLKAAKASGDKKRAGKLELEGQSLQNLIHKQGFGTWPIDDILQTIEDKIPGIAKQANVDLVLSKWNVVYQKKGIKTVDITDLLVAPFQPTAETQKILQSLRKQDPVPLDQLKKH